MIMLIFWIALIATPAAYADENISPPPITEEDVVLSAPIVIDGEKLFEVRGIRSFSADQRSERIKNRILGLARDSSFQPDSLLTKEAERTTDIVTPGGMLVLSIFDIDAQLEGIPRPEIARVYRIKIVEAIKRYRWDRMPDHLTRATFYAIGATVAIAIALLLIIWSFRKTNLALKNYFEPRIKSLKVGTFEVMHASRVRAFVTGLIRGTRILIIFILIYVYLQFTLSLFPWTRGISKQLLYIVLTPLSRMGNAFVDYLPSLIFLVILFFLTRYLLKMVRFFFAGVEHRSITLNGFESEWAQPTYKIVRIFIVAIALVIAYPYVPGSGSEAFKGISIFLGVIVSLGSSSAISNVIAGYTMIYRRTFKVGDRIQVGEFLGDVTDMRLLATYIRTIKNEVVVVPNSLILSSSVVNYSRLAMTEGLILHTIVGIGYETSWRQVEAMLKIAADQTAGLKKEPAPFVLLKNLDDFAVKYEINAFFDRTREVAQVYADLHRNILDQFNEYGVQIMTPAYEGDPETPKVVAKDQWFAAPASPETQPTKNTKG